MNHVSERQEKQSFRRIAVLGALDEEINLIAHNLTKVRQIQKAGLSVTQGEMDPGSDCPPIYLAATVAGMGLVNAAAATQFLLDSFQPDAVIFSGIAGNPNPSLHINDIVLGQTVRYLDSDMSLIGQAYPGLTEYHSDPVLLSAASAVLDSLGIMYKKGTIASGNRFIQGDTAIAEVKEQTGADAAEMEGAAVCHIAAKNDCPALIIRALSDNADTEYDTFKEFDISEYANTAARIVVEVIRELGRHRESSDSR